MIKFKTSLAYKSASFNKNNSKYLFKLHEINAIEYDFRLPVICYTGMGWDIERKLILKDCLKN